MTNNIELINQLKNNIETLESRISVSDEAIKNMCKLYSIIWTEACYDSYNNKSRETAQRCLPFIQALNNEFKFKK